jgi:hypothetical protein
LPRLRHFASELYAFPISTSKIRPNVGVRGQKAAGRIPIETG